jgi:hypothetical protein
LPGRNGIRISAGNVGGFVTVDVHSHQRIKINTFLAMRTAGKILRPADVWLIK